ncbi:EamA family transporter [Parasutterella secunda]|uniref:EamA family transporter n=1 Tax=Parasutterella secunda TaxID=626947 RepID=UPI0025A46877|nr:EamA family transporter [Parasutterella secunda]MDM8087961.1 EamA family transporter [Parasutterella secunda]
MSLTALTLVLTAALVHATWNYFLKKANATRPFWWLVYIITAVITVPALFIYDPQALSNITPIGWLVIALSAPIHVIYGQVLQIGYKKSDYSIVYPTARGTGPLITVLCAVLILGDRPSFWGWIGIVLILASIVLLAMPHKQDKQTQDLRIRAGIFWGFLTGCFIAGYSFCDAWAVQQETGLTPLSFYFPSIAVRAIVFAPFIMMHANWKAESKEILTTPRLQKALAVVTVGSPLAYILVLYAMTIAPLAYVAPSREVGMMIGVVLGGLLLRERLSVTRLAGVIGMTLGVILVGLEG